MFSRLQRTEGFTLVEMLVVMAISLVVFGATLSAWVSVSHSNRALEGQEDNAEEARVSLDRATRQLRNLANPTVNAITTIDRATDYDFIFQTSDPSKTWVRYCLQTSGGGTSPSAGDAVGERERRLDHVRDARLLPRHGLDALAAGRPARHQRGRRRRPRHLHVRVLCRTPSPAARPERPTTRRSSTSA